MEENARLESLVESATDYGKTSYELIKLKLIDKISDIISSLIPHTIVFSIALSFLLFCNLGIVFLLGDILGEIYLGFFAVAAFYALAAIVMYFILNKKLKKNICNYIIIKLLK